MRTAIIALVFLCCCQTTQKFKIKAGTLPGDAAIVQNVIDIVNSEAGCTLLALDNSAQSEIEFSTFASCRSDLDGGGSGDTGGETVLNAFSPPLICEQSFTTTPITLEWKDNSVPDWEGMAVVVYMHEIGHAAGLQHTNTYGDIMYPEVSQLDPFFYSHESVVRFVEQLKKAGNKCL